MWTEATGNSKPGRRVQRTCAGGGCPLPQRKDEGGVAPYLLGGKETAGADGQVFGGGRDGGGGSPAVLARESLHSCHADVCVCVPTCMCERGLSGLTAGIKEAPHLRLFVQVKKNRPQLQAASLSIHPSICGSGPHSRRRGAFYPPSTTITPHLPPYPQCLLMSCKDSPSRPPPPPPPQTQIVSRCVEDRNGEEGGAVLHRGPREQDNLPRLSLDCWV